MRTGPTSLVTQKLIIDLKKTGNKEKAPVWKRVSEELSKATRQRREINLSRINKSVEDGEIALIPGKVLSSGEFSKKVTVAAFRFSEKAKEKIIKAGGKVVSIQQLVKDNPKGKKVRIIG